MELDDRTPCIVGAARTPLGAFQGSLASYSAPCLGGVAIKAAIARAGILPEDVQEVLMGNVLSAHLGQAPATQAARAAGLPASVPCTLVNKVCASGLKAVALAAHAVLAGAVDVVVAGGMESMSNAPHYLPGRTSRKGMRMGDMTLVDAAVFDGLTDALHGVHMGTCAELCAAHYHVTRQEQDAHALTSHARARAAVQHALWEISPVPLGPITTPTHVQGGALSLPGEGVVHDEGLQRSMDSAKLQRLRPAFPAWQGPCGAPLVPPGSAGESHGSLLSSNHGSHHGFIGEGVGGSCVPQGGDSAAVSGASQSAATVTAGNASPLTDGAAAVVVTSWSYARRHGLPVLGVIRGSADAAQEPEWFTTAPALAIPKVLASCGLTTQDIDAWEVNEAFSVVDVVNARLLGLPPDRVNMHGGSVSLGHPIGASGARILVTLLNVLRIKGGRFGCAAICNGGGGATALVVEAPPTNMQRPEDSSDPSARL